MLADGSALSAQRVKARPKVTLGAVRLLITSGGRSGARIDRHDDRDETRGELPERTKEPSLSGGLDPLLLSGERRKGEEGEEEEYDGGTRTRPYCMRHGGTSLLDAGRSDPGVGGRGHSWR